MSKPEVEKTAREISAAIAKLPSADTTSLRAIRKGFSKHIRSKDASFVLDLAKTVIRRHAVANFVTYELIQHHKAAAAALTARDLEDFAGDLDSWWTVDAFASYLSGVARRNGQVTDAFIHKWARSPNVWIRRAALVSTVPLNNKTRGGTGDARRTLAVCDLLIDDREDMVVKAMSWALRELAKRDPASVTAFIVENKDRLAKRALREVNAKLTTGLKNPNRRLKESSI